MNIIRSPRVWGVLPRLLNINEDVSADKKNIDPTIIPIIKPLHSRVDASIVLGLFVGSIGYVLTMVRRRWYQYDLEDIEYILESIEGGKKV
ncbi:hypothetical protein C5S42_03245 [Candidatus Methanomarinus sp.]|nr:hypothetical protein C5S42_03245 [ANME-2 cluster archaeon]